jgi:hypothetical protein
MQFHTGNLSFDFLFSFILAHCVESFAWALSPHLSTVGIKEVFNLK